MDAAFGLDLDLRKIFSKNVTVLPEDNVINTLVCDASMFLKESKLNHALEAFMAFLYCHDIELFIVSDTPAASRAELTGVGFAPHAPVFERNQIYYMLQRRQVKHAVIDTIPAVWPTAAITLDREEIDSFLATFVLSPKGAFA